MAQRLLGARNRNSAAKYQAAQHLSHLQIKEVGNVNRLIFLENIGFNERCRRRPDQCFQQRRGIDNDHRVSRSARTASSIEMPGSTGSRFLNCSRISAMVGIWAPRRSSRSM